MRSLQFQWQQNEIFKEILIGWKIVSDMCLKSMLLWTRLGKQQEWQVNIARPMALIVNLSNGGFL